MLHCPTFHAPMHAAMPLVATFHDLAVLRVPRCFNRWSRLYGAHVLERVARSLAAVIAVSEFTRDELVELLGVREERDPRRSQRRRPAVHARRARQHRASTSSPSPRSSRARTSTASSRRSSAPTSSGCELRVVELRAGAT